MRYTIDIDTGGTFTDGFIAKDGQFRSVKTPTTPHDLTQCFWECIKSCANAFGVSEQQLLMNTDVIRFSNTIGTNSIIQRDGSKIGLLLTRGAESLAPTVDPEGKPPLVQPDMVISIEEATDNAGNVAQVPDERQVLEAAQTLLDRGARCLVICLENSEFNADNERDVRAIIKREYPKDYLGSVPVFISSEISYRTGFLPRINAAVLNAYIHSKLTRLLYKASEKLRNNGFPGQLLIGHNNGSAARVAKTRAIDTYNSGPAAGLIGAQSIGEKYGSAYTISADMGGTSFDIGFIKAQQPSYALNPNVEGFECNLPMLAIRALGIGGGSIAFVRDGVLHVGPQSAGALPGPACFDLGGALPTVTDANLVLGLLDPDRFLGGAKSLSREKAVTAIRTHVADLLGITVEDAALRIKRIVDREVGQSISDLCRKEDMPVDESMLVVYGGAGPLHSCEIAADAGVRKIVITPFSAVFSAFSSSLIDVGHVYHALAMIPLAETSNFSELHEAVMSMRKRAIQDMRGEGYQEATLNWAMELVVQHVETKHEERLLLPLKGFDKPLDIQRLHEEAVVLLAASPEDEILLISVGLQVYAEITHYEQIRYPVAKSDATEAIFARRNVHFELDQPAQQVAVYDHAKLDHGHALSGPAIVESDQTTILVNECWTLRVDEYRNAILQFEEVAA